ncbi:type IV pilin [Methanoregula sp.]|uniref:type IV pilin n=1 Tax=Methanoregula sp. TaxID=2052170 RepID=UPI003C151581
MIKNRKLRETEGAVSPVVGVMLMLVVTIIIAAVVSGFAGGLIGGGSNQKTPTLAMDVKITNNGENGTSIFSATVNSISDPTPSKNLLLTTSWVTTMKNQAWSTGNKASTAVGTAFASGGNSTIGSAPYGFGPGVTGLTVLYAPYTGNQTYGNFTVTQGTGLVAEPNSQYSGYLNSGGVNSAMQTVLGSGWEQLSPGDTVTVRVIYAPTGKAIFQQNVAVTGS